MQYFLTGATGFIGSHIAQAILDGGHHLRALRRNKTVPANLVPYQDRIEWVEGDLLDIIALDQYLTDTDVIVHAAAVVSFHGSEAKAMLETNVTGTANLVNMALAKQITRFIHVSSIAAIGRSTTQTEPITEETKWADSPLNSQYAISKYQAELEVWRGHAEGLQVIVLNPSIVLGFGDWTRSSLQIFKKIYEGLKYYPLGMLNYVDVRDVARAVTHLPHAEAWGERYILNSGTIAYRDFLTEVAQRFGLKPPHVALKGWLLGIAWRLFAVAGWLSRTKPLITRETAQSSSNAFYYNGTKITQTGFNYHSLDQTLDWACSSFIATYGPPKQR